VHDRACLDDALLQFRKLRDLAEKALAQVDEADWFRTLDPESNSIALVLKHLSGNMRSRWTDFLATDGEKPDRNRDSEFEKEGRDTAASLRARWDEGWRLLFAALEPLGPADLARTVTVRGEPHTVLQAIHRQMTHYAYHVGQVVLLARHFAGPRWNSLSIPKGRSKDFEVAKDGSAYRLRGS
jgi:uncharacterized damage-inducible protein DinB